MRNTFAVHVKQSQRPRQHTSDLHESPHTYQFWQRTHKWLFHQGVSKSASQGINKIWSGKFCDRPDIDTCLPQVIGDVEPVFLDTRFANGRNILLIWNLTLMSICRSDSMKKQVGHLEWTLSRP